MAKYLKELSIINSLLIYQIIIFCLSTNPESMCSIQFSSITALLEACNTDIRNVNAVALLDLKKAFATVNHDILLSKLHLYSISGVTSHKCFSSCLDNHIQKCLVSGSLSECCTVKCSIP